MANITECVPKKVLLGGDIMWKASKAYEIQDTVKITPTILTRVTDPDKHLPCIVNYIQLELIGAALGKHTQKENCYWVQVHTLVREITGEQQATQLRKATFSISDQLGQHTSMFTLCSEEELHELEGDQIAVNYKVTVVPLDADEDLADKNLAIDCL